MSDDKKKKQLDYVRAHYERRKAAGDIRTNIWFTPAAAEALEKAMKASGQNKEATITQALLELASRV